MDSTLTNEQHFANVFAAAKGEPHRNGNGQTAKQTRKIAIIGKAPSSAHLAPYDDPEWDIYGLSNGAPKLPRWTKWFEIHDLEAGMKRWGELCPEYPVWLKTDHGRPLYLQKPHPEIPHATVYPWEQVFAKFGTYMNNSVSLMIAVALLDGATHLGIFGVDMAQSDASLHDGQPEYQHQRPSCEYMVGFARGMGVDVYIPPESDLLKCTRVYGYPGEAGEMVRKARARKSELGQRQASFQQNLRFHKEEREEWRVRAALAEGRLLQAGEMKAPEEQIKALRAEYEASKQQYRIHKYAYDDMQAAIHKFSGAVEDNDYWMTRVQT